MPETIVSFGLLQSEWVSEGKKYYRPEFYTLTRERDSLPPLSSPLPSEQASVIAAGTKAGSGYMFRRVGKHWKVIFRDGRAFRLRNTLGARYLNYLLHEPNKPIGAFDLEVEVQPDKGEARVRDSIQPESDPEAMREYRQELGQLQNERGRAQAASHREEVERLDGQIEALESAPKAGGGAADMGERARDNVRKAIAVVTEQLREGGPEEKTFAEYLQSHLSIGHECLYSQPQGRLWD